ncbi:GNAT family N-acetyltransferase [Desulfoscipio gibsoniae]
MVLETSRLYLRKIQVDDYNDICTILQDIDVMYAWGHAFSDIEVTEWINENIMRYSRDGYSYWAVIEKISDKLIGVTGLIAEKVDNEDHVGVGYIYDKAYWKKGYAFEGAAACVDYALNTLHINEITAQIRPENESSRKVAEKLGMSIKKDFIRRYKGEDIPHLLYACNSLVQARLPLAGHWQWRGKGCRLFCQKRLCC